MSQTSSNKPRSTGASQGSIGFQSRVDAWRSHHKHTAVDSFQRLCKSPVQTLMTVLVVAIALTLPATLMVSLNNLQQLGQRWDAQPKLSVFINVLAKEQAIELLQKKLQAWPEVEQVSYISADQALLDFQASSGFGEVLKDLDENPLPPTLVISPQKSQLSTEQLKRLSDRIQAEPIVDLVQYDMEWVRKLKHIMALGQKIVLALAALLSLGVLLAIGNTIRLEIENRREEIVVIKLVGATDGFVRRPFMYSGAWYGLLGGGLAVILVSVGLAYIQTSVSRLAAEYNSDFAMQGLGFDGVVSLVLISVSLGFFGAWLAVGRHLSAIEPQ